MRQIAHRARSQRRQGALAVLRHVHAHPAVTRADVARVLGISSGSATEITARLKASWLVAEAEPVPAAGRGRPSHALVAHPRGPLVCVVDIGHEHWRVATVELGADIAGLESGRHPGRDADTVLEHLRGKVAAVYRRHGARVRVVSVAVAGTVRSSTVVQASGMGWGDVDLRRLSPSPGIGLLVGNDASLAGLAEARRGAGMGARVVLHLTVEVGVGGVLVVDGRAVEGATDASGEFGHLPFGDPDRACPCGAYGCWDLDVDGRAMARALGQPPPRDPRTFAERVVRAAADGDPPARAAVAVAARALGRGIGGLVNALDPELVSLSGLGIALAAAAPVDLDAGYRAALMRFRRSAPPPLLSSTLGPLSPVIGAAEAAFDILLTAEGLESWLAETG